MAYLHIDADVDVNEFWDTCAESERDELRELVTEYYDIQDPAEDEITLSEYAEKLARGMVGCDSIEARDFIKRTLEEMEYKLKMRDFS